MKKEWRLIKAWGKNEVGLADVPQKVSGVTISRIIIGPESGCSRCFPHGYETINSHIANRQRSWKKQRKTKWKLERHENGFGHQKEGTTELCAAGRRRRHSPSPDHVKLFACRGSSKGWVIKNESGDIVGFLTATIHQDGDAHIGYSIGSRFWGNGYARCATKQLLLLLSQRNCVRRFCIIAECENTRAVLLARTLGFVKEASESERQKNALSPSEILLHKVVTDYKPP